MKIVFFFLALLVPVHLAEAHKFYQPTLDRVAASDAVYLVKAQGTFVTEDDVHKHAFTVTEVLRGQPQTIMILIGSPGVTYSNGSEWVIFHHGGRSKNWIGWSMLGDYEWLPMKVTRNGNEVTVQWIGPLDTLRAYLLQHPMKQP
jgi:hypothetical protein